MASAVLLVSGGKVAAVRALKKEALRLATQPGRTLELGEALRRIYAQQPSEFRALIGKPGLGQRMAYYLLEVSRRIREAGVTAAQARKLGWTKLQIIGKCLTPQNAADLLSRAEDRTAHELTLLMRRNPLPLSGSSARKRPNAKRCVLFYFTPAEYEEFRDALVIHGGAQRTSRGLVNKNEALLKLVRRISRRSMSRSGKFLSPMNRM
jgi:hypothetical protein